MFIFSLVRTSCLLACLQIIDVREKNELAVASIKGADIVNLPLSEADIWGPKVEAGQLLDAAKPTICLCKAGMRRYTTPH